MLRNSKHELFHNIERNGTRDDVTQLMSLVMPTAMGK